jgi:dolichyl-phosphate-mannose-protein mannosyltransferase
MTTANCVAEQQVCGIETEPQVLENANQVPGAKLTATCLLVGSLALVLLTTAISRPWTYVFDEEIYATGARMLLSGSGYPNPEHPPLGKYLIAAGVAAVGDKPAGWRIASALCGSLTVVAVFLWTWLLLRDRSLAVTAAALTLLNNFHYVMARTTMLDVPMFMFSMFGLVGFVAAIELDWTSSARRAAVLFSGAMFGLAGASKWTALATFAAVLATCLALLCVRRFDSVVCAPLARQAGNLRRIGMPTLIAGLLLLPVAVYLSCYIPVLYALHTPFSLTGMIKTQFSMWTISKGVVGNRVIYSPWYRWPFATSPMRALSCLLGNAVVMWGGLLAMAVCLWRLCRRPAFAEAVVLILYSANLLIWPLVPRRITYYYYYYPAAMFLATAIAVALRRVPTPQIAGIRLHVVAITAAAVVFVYFYPQMAHLDAPWDCMFGCWD